MSILDAFILALTNSFSFTFSLIVTSFATLVIIGTIIVDLKNRNSDETESMNENQEKSTSPASFWRQVSLQENFSSLLTTKVPKDALTSVYGLRSIAMLWVIAGHNTIYATMINDNQQLMFETYGHYLNSFVSVAIIISDFFFVFSGFLVSYLFFERMKRGQPKNLIAYCFNTIFKRWLRMGPAFMLIVLLSTVLGMYLNDISSFIVQEDMEFNCKNYWWRNLFFMQNWFSVSLIMTLDPLDIHI